MNSSPRKTDTTRYNRWAWPLLAILLLLSSQSCATRDAPTKAEPPKISRSPQRSLWKVVLQTHQLGPLETYLELERSDQGLSGHSLSGIRPIVANLPQSQGKGVHLDDFLFAFKTTPSSPSGQEFKGKLTAPWVEEGLVLELTDEKLSGTLNHWLLGGTISGIPAESVRKTRDFVSIIHTLDNVVPEKIFDPSLLTAESYQTFRKNLGVIAKNAVDDLDLILGFHLAWSDNPFSHFQLRRSEVSAESLFASFDSMNVGYEAARLELEGERAILRVDTMMGNDTIEQIKAAFQAIDRAGATQLIIDLRGNGGGAFAVKPLVEHVIDQPITSGYFLSQQWAANHDSPPTEHDVDQTTAWQGWSISSFWHTVQKRPIMKLEFTPAVPNFNGPVYVLVDRWSASATEIAADAFRSSEVAVLVGETTAGELLSQSYFDLTEGYLIALPVADYYSTKHGRIEGRGVDVTIPCPPDEALEAAKRELQNQ